MTRKYRVGDLIMTNEGNRYIYNRLIDIIYKDNEVGYGESLYELEITTHEGYINSDTKLLIKPFASIIESDSGIPLSIDYEHGDIIYIDPHNITLMDDKRYIYTIDNLNRKIEMLNSKIEFLKKHRNRIDKLDELL